MRRKQITTAVTIVLSCAIGLGGNMLFSGGTDTVDRRLVPCDVPMVLLTHQAWAGRQATVVAQPAGGFFVTLSLGGGKALPLVRMAISYLDAPRLSGENSARLR